jgi:hypothetical protein
VFSLIVALTPLVSHELQLSAPASASAAAAARATTSCACAATASSGALHASTSAAIPGKALLAPRTVGASSAALTIVAERACAPASVTLLTVAALWLPLVLSEIVGAPLVLVHARAVLLLATSVLLVEVGLAGAVLLIEVRLATAVSCQVLCIFISELLLVQVLIEVRLVTAVEIVGAVIAVDVVREPLNNHSHLAGNDSQGKS